MARALITITDQAANEIKTLLSKRDKPAVGIRVKVKQGGCAGLSYKFEYAEQVDTITDNVISDKDVNVLIDRKAELFLIGSVMDFVDDDKGRGFRFVNPNETGRCGCGESFYVKKDGA